MSKSVLQFVIVGQDDQPIYEADLSAKPATADGREERPQYLHHFVLHAALDAVEEQEWTTSSMHLGIVDGFNDLQVSAYTTACRTRFLLLHDKVNDELVKAFFKDVYDLYLKLALNPFFLPTVKIASPAFHQKVKHLARNYFRL